MLHLSLVLVVAYEWRAYECELITPCRIVDIVDSDRNSSLYNSCSVCSESGRPVEVEQNERQMIDSFKLLHVVYNVHEKHLKLETELCQI